MSACPKFSPGWDRNPLAGGAIWEHISGVNMFSPSIGFAVFCGYAAVAITAGLVLFLRRDA